MNLLQMMAPSTVWSRMDADEIEQKIIRAYIRLACTPKDRSGSRAVTVLRIGALEARLTEVPLETLPVGMPSFWLEIHSHASQSTIDSCGCSEFNEDELAAAVDLITRATERTRIVQ